MGTPKPNLGMRMGTHARETTTKSSWHLGRVGARAGLGLGLGLGFGFGLDGVEQAPRVLEIGLRREA